MSGDDDKTNRSERSEEESAGGSQSRSSRRRSSESSEKRRSRSNRESASKRRHSSSDSASDATTRTDAMRKKSSRTTTSSRPATAKEVTSVDRSTDHSSDRKLVPLANVKTNKRHTTSADQDQQLFERMTSDLIRFRDTQPSREPHWLFWGLLVSFASVLALSVFYWVLQTAGVVPFLF
ncbi:MAG: hypothetical protein R3C28_19950 [Pirellulaceae bacterium]